MHSLKVGVESLVTVPGAGTMMTGAAMRHRAVAQVAPLGQFSGPRHWTQLPAWQTGPTALLAHSGSVPHCTRTGTSKVLVFDGTLRTVRPFGPLLLATALTVANGLVLAEIKD